MTAANKYSCKLDGRDKDCINDPPQAEEEGGGGEGEKAAEEGKRRIEIQLSKPKYVTIYRMTSLLLVDDSDELFQ